MASYGCGRGMNSCSVCAAAPAAAVPWQITKDWCHPYSTMLVNPLSLTIIILCKLLHLMTPPVWCSSRVPLVRARQSKQHAARQLPRLKARRTRMADIISKHQ